MSGAGTLQQESKQDAEQRPFLYITGGHIKTKGGQREGYEHRGGLSIFTIKQFAAKRTSLSFFLKFSVLVYFFKKYPFIPQSAVFPLACVQVHRKHIYSLWYTPLSCRVLGGCRGQRQGERSVPPCAQVPRAVERGRGRRSSTSPRRHLGGSGLGLALLSLLRWRRRGWWWQS